MSSEAKENESKESQTKYQNLMRENVNYQNQMILRKIDLNDQIKQTKKENELLLKQKEDRIDQLEKEFERFKGQMIYLFLFVMCRCFKYFLTNRNKKQGSK